MGFLKTITGKIVTGLVALGVMMCAITWWQMDAASRDALLSHVGRVLAWLGLVGLLPWVTFMIITRVGRAGSNFPGVILVGAYTLIEAAVLGWLFGWRFSTPSAWVFVVVGVLAAGVYNLLVCDWIAEAMG